jgi:hypothetical protein
MVALFDARISRTPCRTHSRVRVLDDVRKIFVGANLVFALEQSRCLKIRGEAQGFSRTPSSTHL